MNIDKVKETIIKISNKINSEKDYLTQLDNEIADGDHGINLARGFSAVEEMLKTSTDSDIGSLFKNIGMKLVSSVGGAAGPLYGTAFIRAAGVVNGKQEINEDDYINCLNAAIEGIKFRGKAVFGEKTMLDSLIPAYEQITKIFNETSNIKQALVNGVKAAYDGVEYTKTIIATKGRASYIGERSLGHQDPGATSITFLLETICKEI